MGLLRWLRQARTPDPRRPWVRPEFLGLLALFMVGGAAVAYYASTGSIGADAPPVAAQKKDYVGVSPVESLACAPDCNVDGRLYLWGLDHPDARILEKNATYHNGVVIGYEIVYVEE